MQRQLMYPLPWRTLAALARYDTQGAPWWLAKTPANNANIVNSTSSSLCNNSSLHNFTKRANKELKLIGETQANELGVINQNLLDHYEAQSP